MREARLSTTGISIETNACISCLGLSDSFIRYADIVNFEQRHSHHYVVKFMKHSQKEARLKQELLYISPDKAQHVEAELDSEMLAAMDDDSLTDSFSSDGSSVEAKVMRRSFAHCLNPHTRKPVLVILNPKSGPGNSVHQYEEHVAPIFAAAGLRTSVVVTTYSGQATEIAERVSMEDHDCIVCVSGDGLPHEVLNGLAKRADAQQALQHFSLAQLPGGSGNAMSTSLNQGKSDWGVVALGIVKGVPEPHDIMKISQGSEVYYSFLSQSFGIVADCDLGTEDMRWMGGSRFTVGIIMKSLAANSYPCKIAYHEAHGAANARDSGDTSNGGTNGTSVSSQLTVNDEIPADWQVESHPNLSMFYVGKMSWMSSDARVFPYSEPLDGAMDMMVWDTSLGAFTALSVMMEFEKGTHVSRVPFYKKVDAYRLIPTGTKNYLSVDGESYPCTPIQVNVVRGGARFVVPLV